MVANVCYYGNEEQNSRSISFILLLRLGKAVMGRCILPGSKTVARFVP